jgi:hypothetical protein
VEQVVLLGQTTEYRVRTQYFRIKPRLGADMVERVVPTAGREVRVAGVETLLIRAVVVLRSQTQCRVMRVEMRPMLRIIPAAVAAVLVRLGVLARHPMVAMEHPHL